MSSKFKEDVKSVSIDTKPKLSRLLKKINKVHKIRGPLITEAIGSCLSCLIVNMALQFYLQIKETVANYGNGGLYIMVGNS